MKPEALSIRPYARLLTMLGDQLIKNERIALVELIKNAYDADAGRVEVRFEDFNNDMTNNTDSRIIVRDDGMGMTLETVQAQWMNPATPKKHLDKQQGKNKTLVNKRIIQGEKGIGRFAVLKLGRIIKVTTRPPQADWETILDYDFSRFDEDFVSENGRPKEIFLDEIKIDCLQSKPEKLPGTEHGTVIEIQGLKGVWNNKIVEQLRQDVGSLTDPVSRITHREASDHFEIDIFCNGELQPLKDEDGLKSLIEDKSVLRIQGDFRSGENAFFYRTQADEKIIELEDPKIKGLWVWGQRWKNAANATAKQKYICGDFSFQFYIFDFAHRTEGRYALNQAEKKQIKGRRIYLYRDNMRVYPYGDPDNDWLEIDVTRGTGRAGDFFSNAQIIGWIDITQKDNPDLRDKTNREGLIETGGAASDLIFLAKVFLSYIKQYPYARYQKKKSQRNTARSVRDETVARHLENLQKKLEESGDKTHAGEIKKIKAEYQQEKHYLSQRVEVTEDLAGVGLSVEMASHDIMLLINRAQEISKQLARASRAPDRNKIQEQADMLVGVLQQVTDGMRDVQHLFKSSRRRRKVLRIEPVLDKIYHIYKALLEERGIHYQKTKVCDSPLTANTTDGVIMQVLINLFDNASYWLDTVDPEDRRIHVVIDGEQGNLVFSDNGPGIEPEDLPYIFEPFYSGKGQEGRGLGLYIARQLLERHDYQITIAENHQKVLPGANFVVSFVKENT